MPEADQMTPDIAGGIGVQTPTRFMGQPLSNMPGETDQNDPMTLLSQALGRQANPQDVAYLRAQLAQGSDINSILRELGGNATPSPGLAAGLSMGLNKLSGLTAQGLRNTPLSTLPGMSVAGPIIGALTGKGASPTIGNEASTVPGGTAAVNFAGGSIPYALAGTLAPEGVASAGFSALAGLQAGQAIDAYQKGQMSGAQLTAQLAQVLGPILAPKLLPLAVEGAQAAGTSVSDWMQSPAGQQVIQRLQAEGGGLKLPFGNKNPLELPAGQSVVENFPGEGAPASNLPPEGTIEAGLARSADPLQPVQDWLQRANVLREKQTQNVAEMRAQQAARIASVDPTLSPEARLNAKLAAARGSAAQETMWIPSEQAVPAVSHGIDLIENSAIPELGAPQAKMNLQNAWRNFLLTGELPQPNQLDKMEKVFGPTLVQQIRDFTPPKGGFSPVDLYVNAANFLRTMKTIIPLHGMLRNGVFEAPAHPLIWLNQFLPQLKGLKDPAFTRALDEEIHNSPEAYRSDGTGYLDQRADGRGPRLKIYNLKETDPLARDEGVMSQWADNIPGVTRAKNDYLTFLNDFRRQIYNSEAESLRNPGWIARTFFNAKPETDPAVFDRLAEHIAHGTGWSNATIGDLSPKINPFFSFKRNVAMLQWPADLVSEIRQGNFRSAAGIAKDLAAFTGSATVGLGLLNLAGSKMGVTAGIDPFNSDFGKVRVGNTRIDTMGGSAQVIRAMAQLMGGRADANGQQYEKSRQDTIENFLRSKLEPVAGAAVDFYTGKTVIGQNVRTPSGALDEVVNAFTPLVLDEMRKAAQDSGIKGGALSLPSILGAGVETYGPGAGSRAGLLQNLGLPPDATPQQILEAEQKNPQALQTYNQAVQGRGGPTAIYNKAAADALTTQQQSDTALQNQSITSNQWRDAYHTTQDNLAYLRKYLNLSGGPNTNDPQVVQDYYAVLGKYPNADSDPTQKQAMFDALDQFQAGLSPADQKTLDQYVGFGAGTSPMVREYRDTVQQLSKAGYYNAEKDLLKQIGLGAYSSVSQIVDEAVNQITAQAKGLSPAQAAALRQAVTNKIAPRFNRLDALINAYKFTLIQNDPQLIGEAVKFGLVQSKEALMSALQGDQTLQPQLQTTP